MINGDVPVLVNGEYSLANPLQMFYLACRIIESNHAVVGKMNAGNLGPFLKKYHSICGTSQPFSEAFIAFWGSPGIRSACKAR
ncbi:hypothetical protein D3C87_1976810 [compost metagenome]